MKYESEYKPLVNKSNNNINCCQDATTSQFNYNKLIDSIQRTPISITNKQPHCSFNIANLININDSKDLTNNNKLNNNQSNQNLLIKSPICKNKKNFSQKIDKDNNKEEFDSFEIPKLLPEVYFIKIYNFKNIFFYKII